MCFVSHWGQYQYINMTTAALTAAQCQELANHYKSLSQLSGISTDRAFILKNIARSLAGLASQLDRLAVLMRDEAK
jgi:hypothetical protein